jgi:hypothetical protein
MNEGRQPPDYETPAGKRPSVGAGPVASGLGGRRRRWADVSDTRWVVVVLLTAFTIQSTVYPCEIYHSYNVSFGSGLCCLIVLTRETDIFVTRLWIPYPALALLVLWGPLRRHRRTADIGVPRRWWEGPG